MGAREGGKKCLKMGQKNWKQYLKKNKYQSVTHVSTFIFQGLFKNIVFKMGPKMFV